MVWEVLKRQHCYARLAKVLFRNGVETGFLAVI